MRLGPIIIAVACGLIMVYLVTFTWREVTPQLRDCPINIDMLNRTVLSNNAVVYCLPLDYNISVIPGDVHQPPTTPPTAAPIAAPVVCPDNTNTNTAAAPPPTKKGAILTHRFDREPFDKKFDEMYDKYIEFHKTTLANEKLGIKGKYVHVEANAGLGNRLRPYVSGFILALMTGRACVIDWQWSEKLSNWIDPGFEFFRPSWLDLKSADRTQTTTNFEGATAIPALFENLTAYFEQYDVIHLHTINYPSVLFYDNPYHKDWLLEKFAYNAYTIIVRRLYKLTPFTQKIVDDFKAQNFGEVTIGIQLRASRPVWNKNGPPLHLFWETAELLQQQYFPYSKNTTKYFLATDTRSVQGDARAALGSAMTWVEPFRERYTADAELYAFIDHVLLGECDSIVVTFTSTYGNIAVGWKSAPGIMVYHDGTWGTYSVTEPFYWDASGVFKIFEDRKLPVPPLLRWQVRAVYFK